MYGYKLGILISQDRTDKFESLVKLRGNRIKANEQTSCLNKCQRDTAAENPAVLQGSVRQLGTQELALDAQDGNGGPPSVTMLEEPQPALTEPHARQLRTRQAKPGSTDAESPITTSKKATQVSGELQTGPSRGNFCPLLLQPNLLRKLIRRGIK